jgi:putative transcriptional regulator
MNRISSIRAQLGVTQTAMADALHVTQGNISHYERGQGVPPEVAKRLIAFALTLGHEVSFDDIYGPPLASGNRGASAVPDGARTGRQAMTTSTLETAQDNFGIELAGSVPRSGNDRRSG